MTGKFIVWVIIGLLIVGRIVEIILPYSGKQKGKITAKWLLACFVVSGVIVYASGICEFTFYVRDINMIDVIIGILFISLSVILKVWALKTLGKYWSIQIEIRDDQNLVTEGPYKYIRHPAYVSTLLEAIGGALILNAFFTLLLFWVIYFPLMVIRIYLEENELKRKFGMKYRDYQEKVSALLPIKMLIK
jgi:protein-S-isoprenylcysteine O-methyltransferase Ste14